MEGNGGEDSSALNRALLKFRPIAPKPFTGGPITNLPKRTKRKYVRSVRKVGQEDANANSNNNNDNEKNNNNKGDAKCVETLQLLPQMADESSSGGGSSGSEVDPSRVVGDNNREWLSLRKIGEYDCLGVDRVSDPTAVADPSAAMDQMGGVEWWVTIECVGGTCTIAPPHPFHQSFGFGLGLASADEERMKMILEQDTCPGFISDGLSRVQWLNGAFKRMVMVTPQQLEMTVWLSMNDMLPQTTVNSSAFTCQVQLKYTVMGPRKYYYSLLVPADMWRMDAGGFAWRLDVSAALTLRR